ncbi:hypothetical protein MBEHAL_1217 [Halarchaeum acidiphilum MH1-52-1]|uniref:Uncharacterized protein n=1 Tax=Halarchaeum acidiphilum MH1-52-1 TaxID=1261545 RepID=U2YUM3_9EURY|nr:hypothetical protein MBEHAL_1217 [Halarchaeum acidiphilum MH1-52-1]
MAVPSDFHDVPDYSRMTDKAVGRVDPAASLPRPRRRSESAVAFLDEAYVKEYGHHRW